MRDYGRSDPALIDDLAQETYYELCSDDARLLRKIRDFEDHAIRAYIRRTSQTTARDHFRGVFRQKRGSGVASEPLDNVPASEPTSELRVLLGQVDDLVRQVVSSERDHNIFWLHYRQGYSAVEIARLPNISLSAKGVESCIARTFANVVKRLRGGDNGKGNSSGFDVKGDR